MGRIPDTRRLASKSLRTSGASAGLAALLLTALAGCASKGPSGGNVVVDDTRPEPRPSATPAAKDAAAALDAAYAEGGTTAACDQCACTPDAHFCFGGNYQLQPEAPADAGDAGLPACAQVSGTTPEAGGATLLPALGCNAIPAACAATPTCECILAALQPLTSCYLVCAHPGAQIRVACPSP